MPKKFKANVEEFWLPKESPVWWLCFPEETAQHAGENLKMLVANAFVWLAQQRRDDNRENMLISAEFCGDKWQNFTHAKLAKGVV